MLPEFRMVCPLLTDWEWQVLHRIERHTQVRLGSQMGSLGHQGRNEQKGAAEQGGGRAGQGR